MDLVAVYEQRAVNELYKIAFLLDECTTCRLHYHNTSTIPAREDFISLSHLQREDANDTKHTSQAYSDHGVAHRCSRHVSRASPRGGRCD